MTAKVIWVSRFGPMAVGGIEHVLRCLIDANKISLVVCMRESGILPRYYCEKGVKVLELENLGRLGRIDLNISMFFVVFAISLFAKSKIVVNLPFLQAMPLLVLRLKRVFYFIHGFSSTGIAGALHKSLLLALTKKQRVIVTSEASAKLFHQSTECFVLPLSLNKRQEDILLNRESSDGGYFLFIGRMTEYKGVDVILEVLRKQNVSATDQILRVNFIGPGTEKINQHRIPGAKGFGFVSIEEKEQLLLNCRALLLPSVGDGEGFGVVQLEALACGKSVIVSKLKTGIDKVAGEFAVTVTPRSVKALQQALCRNYDFDTGKIRRYYKENYCYDTFLQRFIEIIG